MMTYSEMERELNEIPKFGAKASLSNLSAYLELANHPERNLRVIHIAGTNGKGSVSAYIDSILRQAGYTTALFTSPHLIKINERFRINFKECSDEELINAWCSVKDYMVKGEEKGLQSLTFFEILFFMGMLIFSEKAIDYCILETGLGGRLDATTAVENPVACVITSISFDHMQYLGNTIEAIAGEKAGIIVPGVPVIYDGNNPKAAKVIREHAVELGSPYYEVRKSDTEIIRNTRSGIDFLFKNGYYDNTVFSIPFIAGYQVMNSSLALQTIQILKEQIPVSEDALKKGLSETRWQGRMETVLPGVIVDGAHNEDGVAKFVETAAHFQKEYPLTLLFSAVDDKDYTEMISTILDKIHFRHVVVTQVGGYRKVPAEKFAEIFREHGVPTAECCDNVPEAFHRALAEKGEDGLLFCVGSLYLVGEIKAEIAKGETL